MDVKEFVARSLTEILEGVKQAQEGEDGMLVNAAVNHGRGHLPLGGHLFEGQFGVFTRIDFDLAVTVDTKDSSGGEGKLVIFGSSLGGKGEHVDAVKSVSRIAFSVPIQIPDGDQSRLEEYREASKAREQERKQKHEATMASWRNRNRGSAV